MNQQDRNYLQNRISAAERSANSKQHRTKYGKPDAVRKAERLIAAYERGIDADRDRVRDQIKAAANVARDSLVIGDPVKALAAVKLFESKKFA